MADLSSHHCIDLDTKYCVVLLIQAIFCVLGYAVPIAAYPIYGAAVAIAIATATKYQTAAP